MRRLKSGRALGLMATYGSIRWCAGNRTFLLYMRSSARAQKLRCTVHHRVSLNDYERWQKKTIHVLEQGLP